MFSKYISALAGTLVMIGALLLTAEAGIVTFSVLRGGFFGRPLSWDFEVVQLLNALIVFCFLPYAQLTSSHVVADLFTANASEKYIAFIDTLSNLIFGCFALLLLWRMTLGAFAYYDPSFPEMTLILEIPLWWVFPPILVTLAVWLLVCVMKAMQSAQAVFAARALSDEGSR